MFLTNQITYCCLKKLRHYHLVASRNWTEKNTSKLEIFIAIFQLSVRIETGFFGVL